VKKASQSMKGPLATGTCRGIAGQAHRASKLAERGLHCGRTSPHHSRDGADGEIRVMRSRHALAGDSLPARNRCCALSGNTKPRQAQHKHIRQALICLIEGKAVCQRVLHQNLT